MTTMLSDLLLSLPVGMPVKTFVFCDVRHVLRCLVGGTMMRVLTSSPLILMLPSPPLVCIKTTTLTEGGSIEMATLPSPPVPLMLFLTVPTKARVHYSYTRCKNIRLVVTRGAYAVPLLIKSVLDGK